MSDYTHPLSNLPLRSIGALLLFFSALAGFQLGVSVSERPDVVGADMLTQAYYSLSLFVVGGVDLGTPQGGPVYGRALLWLAYFGSPILAATTLIEAILNAIAPQKWYLRKLKNHVIVVGSGPLVFSYLRALRASNSTVRLVVVTATGDEAVLDELKQRFGALVVNGDMTHAFFLKQLRVKRALKILLLDDESLRSYEAASVLIAMVAGIGPRIVIHCGKLRFMRAMENTRVAKECETFNSYHLAASGLVRSRLIDHFQQTEAKDNVVLAGFGRFGQTILEELQTHAQDELDTVVIIDVDARRRVLVMDEQKSYASNYQREIFEGNIRHPEVWERISQHIELTGNHTLFVLGTGGEEDNLRTALWLRKKYPQAMVIARSDKTSVFASQIGEEHDIVSISIAQLVEENIPLHWVEFV